MGMYLVGIFVREFRFRQQRPAHDQRHSHLAGDGHPWPPNPHQGNLHTQLSTLNFTAGVYVVRLCNGNDVKTQKIVME